MFEDPMISLRVMILLCFMGMLVMFLFVIRSLAAQTAALKDSFTRQQSAMADMEQQIMDMNFVVRQMSKGTSPAAGTAEQTGQSLNIPANLDELFNTSESAKTPEPPVTVAVPVSGKPEKDYFYPSAAGLDQPDEDLLNISLGLDQGSGPSKSKPEASSLNIKLDK